MTLLLTFLGKFIYFSYKTIIKKQKFYFWIVVENIDLVGIRAIPIVMLLNFLIGIVLTHQGINTLREYGQLDKIPDVVGPVYFRYIGSLISALIVAGRSGSSFAAEIGSMKLNQEIDALKSMNVNPYAMIAIPRMLATVFSMPILTTAAIIAGIAGGMFISRLLIDLSLHQFFTTIITIITIKVFLLTLLKSIVFGIIISFIGCFRGFSIHDNAQILGLMTTRSVVECIFWVIVVDGVISTYYSYLGI